MINILIFSKNRPMQLELLLRSLKGNLVDVGEFFTCVYYKEDEEFHAGYYKTFTKHDWVMPFKQIADDKFQEDINAIIASFEYPFTMLFVDDDVMINKTNLKLILPHFSLNHQSISLSLGLSCDYCYAKGHRQPIPLHKTFGDVIEWNWHLAQQKTDWHYPMTFDGGLYDTLFLKVFLPSIKFDSPNMLAGQMDYFKPVAKCLQLAFAQQKVFNVAANLVQDVCLNRHAEKYGFSVKYLNDKYLAGFIIDTFNLYGREFNSPNGEVEYKFIKE